MTQARLKFASFADYLAWSDDPANFLEGRFELVDGELVEMPPESEPNNWIARCLMFALANSGQIPLRQIVIHSLELQVPVLKAGDSANRYPDLVVLREEHIALTQKRLTITLDMPPPRLVVEVLSPGKKNRERDLVRKRDQYAARCIPEYWLVDPDAETVTVLVWENGVYPESQTTRGKEVISSNEFPELRLTSDQLFGGG
jgi:Uma2 family endonuclease